MVDGPSSRKDPLEGLMRIGQGTLLRKIDRVFDLLEHPDLNRPHGFFRHLALAKGPLEALDGIFTAPLLEEFPRHVGGIIVFRMTPHTHRLTLDEGRPSATAGSRRGIPGRLVDGQDIVAVDDLRGETVRLGPISNMRDRHLSGEGNRVGILIIVADEDDGKSQDGGQVESLVEIASARCPVATVRDGDAWLASNLKGQRRACGHGDPIGHRTDEADDVATEVTEVDIAVLASRESRASPEILGHVFLRLHPLDKVGAEISVGWGNDVPGLQRTRASDGDRLFPGADIATPEDPSLTV